MKIPCQPVRRVDRAGHYPERWRRQRNQAYDMRDLSHGSSALRSITSFPGGAVMNNAPLDRLIARLRAQGMDPRPAGPEQYESRCPCHKGSRHNLSISVGMTGNVVMWCHNV